MTENVINETASPEEVRLAADAIAEHAPETSRELENGDTDDVAADAARLADPDLPQSEYKQIRDRQNEERKGKGGFGVQKRIDKLTREKYQLQEKLKSYEEREQTQPVDDPSAIEERAQVLAEQLAEQRMAEASDRQRQEHEERQQQEMVQSFARRLDEAASKDADFQNLVKSSANLHIPSATIPAIMSLENGHEVALHLARHPEICEQLVGMNEARAIAEVGRIAARLEGGAPSKPIVSSAPPPIKPIGGSTKSQKSIYDPDIPQKDYMRIREAQKRAHR